MRKPALRLPAAFLLRGSPQPVHVAVALCAAAHLSPASSQAQSIASQGTVTRLTRTAFRWFCHRLCLLATPWLHLRADDTPLWHIRLALQAILSCWSLLPCILDLCQFIPRLNCQTCFLSATSSCSSFSNQYSGCTRRHVRACIWHTYM